MKLISEALEKELLSVEDKRFDILEARSILEKVITKQMQLLTIALYSSELLNGRELQKNDLDRMKAICLSLSPNAPVASDAELADYIAESIYNKRWPTITPSDLVDVELRIIGRYEHLWNTIDINEQLAMLGSNYRLFIAGAMQLATSHVKKLIGRNDVATSYDCRYIWGEIGPTSISHGGPVFDFVTEIVTSPYFNECVPGFSIGDTAIIRRIIVKEKHPEEDNTPLFVYMHEVTHTISFSFKNGSPFTLANWDLYNKRDLCRYLIKPHSKDEIDETFKILSHSTLGLLPNKMTDKLLKHLTPIGELLDDLVSSKYITVDNNGLYLCKIYQGGQPWDLF